MTRVTLYELAGADRALRFSPYCWKVRMALAHKGLEAERIPCWFTEKEPIAFSGQTLVPVLVDGTESVHDSWRIALHLEHRYPDRPTLFGGAAAVPLANFANRWADTVLAPALVRIILYDVYTLLAPADQPYFRQTREQRFGQSLEDVVADQPAHIADLRKALVPLRQTLAQQPFLAGDAPAYADYCVFGMFMWARCVSKAVLLDESDPVFAWRERLLDAFDGMARLAPTGRSVTDVADTGGPR
jgi:glutathione S-transferase